jgi:hypothetical protein
MADGSGLPRSVATVTQLGETDFCWQFHAGSVRKLRAALRAAGTVQVDCAAFVQLAHILLGNVRAGAFSLAVGAKHSWVMFQTLKMRGGYLTAGPYDSTGKVSDPGAAKYSPFNSGQWLYGPLPDGRYLGMSQAGPRTRTLREWHAALVSGLAADSDASRFPLSSADSWAAGLMRVEMKMGVYNFARYALFTAPFSPGSARSWAEEHPLGDPDAAVRAALAASGRAEPRRQEESAAAAAPRERIVRRLGLGASGAGPEPE